MLRIEIIAIILTILFILIGFIIGTIRNHIEEYESTDIQNSFKEEYAKAITTEEKINVLNKYLTEEDIIAVAKDLEKMGEYFRQVIPIEGCQGCLYKPNSPHCKDCKYNG